MRVTEILLWSFVVQELLMVNEPSAGHLKVFMGFQLLTLIADGRGVAACATQ
jgi:hypothetical protein